MQQKAEQQSIKLPPIVEQYYEFCVWLLPKVSKFKKDQKYILGTRLQNSALEGLELILSAALSSKTEKLPFLEQAILKLEHTRFYLRLAVQIKMIPPKSYAYGSSKIIETSGKLGAWRKSVLK
jgi:hypothetical protein